MNITRKNQKIFSINAVNNGQFGSKQASAEILTNNIDTLQALPAYSNGWLEATMSGEYLPPLEEFQALNYINTYQIAYNQQKGIPEYHTDTVYYIGDLTRDTAGTAIYRSITDGNTGNALSDITNWSLLADLANLGPATTLISGYSLLRKQITVANNAGSPNTKLDFGAGNFNFDDGTGQAQFTAQTASLNKVFGTDDGMLDTGTVAINETYHIFTIYNPLTGDSKPLASLSLTPSMPSGYTKKDFLTSVLTDGSGFIRQGFWRFLSCGSYYFVHNVMINNGLSVPNTDTASLRDMTVPKGISVLVDIEISVNSSGTATRYGLVTSPLVADSVPSATLFNIYHLQSGTVDTAINPTARSIWTNTAGQIRTRFTDSGGSTGDNTLFTKGWFFNK